MSDDFERTPGGAVLMDGKQLRDETIARIRREMEAMGSPAVCLATVLVGVDKPSQIYVRMKHRNAGEAGLISKGVELPETATQEMVAMGAVFMGLTFGVFVAYGMFAAQARVLILGNVRLMAWINRGFAGIFAALAGRLALGTWQGVYVIEHRRSPHLRKVVLHLMGE